MIGAKVTIRLNKMPQLSGNLRRLAATEVKDAAEECAELARGRAPVLTGALRASIDTNRESDLSRTVEVGEFYGLFVEFGTSKMAANPFMTPSAEATRPSFLHEMQRIAEKAAE